MGVNTESIVSSVPLGLIDEALSLLGQPLVEYVISFCSC